MPTLAKKVVAVNLPERTAGPMDEIFARTERKLLAIREELARRHASGTTAATVMLNPLDDLLLELQLLASSILVDEIKSEAMPGALVRFARKFEELDKCLFGGLPLPAEWLARRRGP